MSDETPTPRPRRRRQADNEGVPPTLPVPPGIPDPRLTDFLGVGVQRSQEVPDAQYIDVDLPAWHDNDDDLLPEYGGPAIDDVDEQAVPDLSGLDLSGGITLVRKDEYGNAVNALELSVERGEIAVSFRWV